MNIGRFRIEFKRENINFGIRRSGILLVNKKSKSEPCLAKNLALKNKFCCKIKCRELIGYGGFMKC